MKKNKNTVEHSDVSTGRDTHIGDKRTTNVNVIFDNIVIGGISLTISVIIICLFIPIGQLNISNHQNFDQISEIEAIDSTIQEKKLKIEEEIKKTTVEKKPVRPIPIKMEGIVLDGQTGYPLEGIEVSGKEKKSITKKDGTFSLTLDEVPKVGGIKLRFFKEGYESKSNRFYEIPKDDIEINLTKINQ